MPLDFGQSDEHAMLADTLRRFAIDRNGFEARAHRLAASPPDRTSLWAPMAELGAVGALIPEDDGGFGGTPRDMAVVLAALAPSLPVEPLLASGVVCGRLLMRAQDDRAKTLLQALIEGSAIVALAHSEGFDPFAPATLVAELQGDGYVLHGFKPAVRHGEAASVVLVSAAAPDGQALFAVASDTPGLNRTGTRLIDGAGAADLRFDAVSAPSAARLELNSAEDALADALEWGLAGLAVESAALVAAINAATFDYLATREQFGVKLASLQALQHKCADMAIAGEEAAAMAHGALTALEQPPSPARSCAVLRSSLACDAAGRLAAHGAVQLFGGMGVSDELIVSHQARRLAAIRSQVGTMDARAARLSTLEGNG
jgi:alkylation response protein AidB-like acyl-CoA dehydrogenase